jgi:lipopolysaccharide transport system ATP-binding protein
MAKGRALIMGDEIEEFWALRDVDFEIRRGDVVGVIGRNGAGKSTLLKILSRITEPTKGRVTIEGRVASLLEVGTGFHPELSGRENIFLNGAILGMTRKEINTKFDEIVDFAGVEKFIDTPVKRYSSGMYVRLAFSVAAHLEPEILIIDEVLAVGDTEFQKKCLGKMKDVAGDGRTVIFVSHNLAAVKNLCSKGIFLASGGVRFQGDVNDVLRHYSDQVNTTGINEHHRSGTGAIRIKNVEFIGSDHASAVLEEVNFRMSVEVFSQSTDIKCWLLFRNEFGEDTLMVMPTESISDIDVGVREVFGSFVNSLRPGRYKISCGVLDGAEIADWNDDVLEYNVYAAFANGRPFDNRLGCTTVSGEWRWRQGRNVP